VAYRPRTMDPLGHVLPMERKCRRILHQADPRDLPAKNVILGQRKRTLFIFIPIIPQCALSLVILLVLFADLEFLPPSVIPENCSPRKGYSGTFSKGCL
jgi:hypothetical protein